MRLYTICVDDRPVLVTNSDAEGPPPDSVMREHLQYMGLWDGDESRLHVRKSRKDEATRWHKARREATEAGDGEAGEEDFLMYLS